MDSKCVNMKYIDGNLVDKKTVLFVQDEDRKAGLFHVIKLEGIMGRRNGIIVERSNGVTYGIHLILTFTGSLKRKFSYDFNRQEIDDFPQYWLRISWRTPAWCKLVFMDGGMLGEFDAAAGITAESLL